MDNSKPLVIFHAACSDGFAASFAAWLKLGDEAEYVPMQYGFKPQDIPVVEGRNVYMLDFSWPKPLTDELFNLANRVVWLDHHKTAFEMWCGKYEKGITHDEDFCERTIRLNDNKSGAYLAWEYFFPGTEVPMLIKHIDDRDRWVFKIPGTKEFNAALRSYEPWSFEQWKEILGDPEADETFFLYTEGEAILRAHDQNVQSVVKGSSRDVWIKADKPIDLPGSFLNGVTQGWQGLAANCPPHLQSDVGHELATQSGTFGLLWSINKDGVCKCSLRSNGDYDVSAIAKIWGGGGHRNAAGFEVDIQTLLGWLK